MEGVREKEGESERASERERERGAQRERARERERERECYVSFCLCWYKLNWENTKLQKWH